VYSPVTLGAVLAGWRAALTGGGLEPEVLGDLRRHYGARAILSTDSGTSALALALRHATGIRPGAPLAALPAWGCYDLATAAELAEVGVLLYDLDPRTLGPDWPSLGRALSAGASAVVAVHPYGLPVDLPEMQRRTAGAGALLIEDAAQAVGASLAGRPAGAVGALGVLSFGRGKGFTGGAGGALLLNPTAPADLELALETSLAASGHGGMAMLKLMAQWLLGRPGLYALPAALPFLKLGQTIYRAPTPAGRLSPAAAAVLQRTWPLQLPEAERRRQHASRLGDAVRESGAGYVPVGWEGGTPGWLRLPLVATDLLRRAADAAPARRLGVSPGYPRLLLDLPGFGTRVRNAGGTFPGARTLAETLITLPTHGQLNAGDLGRLEQWLTSAGGRGGGGVVARSDVDDQPRVATPPAP
jgi:dTDP-4-amino-4,6-dideoxygalactose transaminase